MIIEHAMPGRTGTEERLAALPPRTLAAINRNRRRQGLREIATGAAPVAAAPPPARPGVWIDPRSRIAPKGTPPRGGLWPFEAPPRTCTRAILIVAGGEAPAWTTGLMRPERLVRGCFGSVDELNRSSGWLLRIGHGHREGPLLQLAGPRLRAIETDAGLAVEWLPDLARPDHVEALRLIEAGHGCSAKFLPTKRIDANGASLVAKGMLIHVALVPRAAYRGAVARLFRDRPGTDDERNRQIAATVAASHRAAEVYR
ncbi:hypothetical protein LBMAG47_15500 [Planctomycetia bacterium]|nr:hypothetical protein LBMAG47_15500 [Planctomycetia bacterium]